MPSILSALLTEAKQTPRLSSSLDEVISATVSPESCSSMILNVEVFTTFRFIHDCMNSCSWLAAAAALQIVDGRTGVDSHER